MRRVSGLRRKAVRCIRCENISCEAHLSKLARCPYCNATPFKTHTILFVRRLISKLEVTCPEFEAFISCSICTLTKSSSVLNETGRSEWHQRFSKRDHGFRKCGDWGAAGKECYFRCVNSANIIKKKPIIFSYNFG